jgi:hypothetical protein
VQWLVSRLRPRSNAGIAGRRVAADSAGRHSWDVTVTLKRALIATAIWTVLLVGISAGAIWYVATHPIRGVRMEDRASQLGSGLGMLGTIGYAAIWLPWAASVGKARREALAKSKKEKKEKTRRKK